MRIALLTASLIAFSYSAAAVATAGVCGINNVMVIVFENENAGDVMNDSYFSSLAQQGYYLANSNQITHPSQPNYIAMISGDTNGCRSDSNININANTIVDLLEGKGLSWKAYAESYPGGCFTSSGTSDGLYKRKHVPFISFNNIRSDHSRCSNIVEASQLDQDAASGSLPNYMFVTPNMDDDGHDTDIPTASQWLQNFIGPKLNDPAYASTLFWVTFDECAGRGSDNIYTVLLGAGIAGAGQTDNNQYDHYSQLATIEHIFGLGNLGANDANASIVPLAC